MYKAVIGYTTGLAALLVYIIYTARFIKPLLRSPLFSKPVKWFHLIMTWLIPFIWLVLLKVIMKPSPGSHQVTQKDKWKPFSDAYKPPR
ncbi:hypothetical protein [Paraflavitalea pollutisoli]|uniref:hypothetical protein n=1 Tax=Paraflavitalea pollutisoli TaxID=3034143 RepID=UPI0023EC16EF|nr:hypothetical protein [Paraflavitalea sp. H1-2-19X]